ncbi:MAG: UDP-N-acetylglucosamine--N-acetylmuramyl-(pentapeptide) pyrophosphoryl-undecaprenol N-acetylglucosamine transferase [Candidatus Pacebacteria bacterium]|nr:UDP-N-acetylglucosamine--N-acetylmuramyl-(pentapeptide) pyrophosphoryl-undecaprenol N-acetylglucosamine transferase [Candidatus Paceibacterota bacterium]
MKVMFTGGGTGGHIFPIIAVAREMKKISPAGELELSYIGPSDEFASKNFFKEGIKTYFILAGKIRRYFGLALFQNIIDLFILTPLGIIQSFLILFFAAPDVIFSKGGYGSVPAVIAGTLLGIPVYLHESDVSPGLANKILGGLSQKIIVSFPINQIEGFSKLKLEFLGNPVRQELLDVDQSKIKETLGLASQKPVILILGGSQGSARINEFILETLPQMLKYFEIIHQTGKSDFENIKSGVKAFVPADLQPNYHPFSFLEEQQLKSAMSAASCIIARAGAGTIAEIAAFARPSILIPLPEAAQNHQSKNAYAYAASGAAIVIEESNLMPNFFLEKVLDLFNGKKLLAMSTVAASFGKVNAARDIALFILK